MDEILSKCKNSSEKKLELMRGIASDMFANESGFLIGVNGSLARREFTSGSDVDLFFLAFDKGQVDRAKCEQKKYRTKLEEQGIKMPAEGGTFGDIFTLDDLMANIGGENESNDVLTRRMLFLLEGDWILNEDKFNEFRLALIEKYVGDGMDEKKACLYLLNDIIRYWRTICIDYEHKISAKGKPKAIRHIKLRFSRMLLYFAGIVAIAPTANKSVPEKRETLNRLFSIPPIKRIQQELREKSEEVLQLYAEFLKAIDNPEKRVELEKSGDDGLNTEIYKDLKMKARTFKDKLVQVLLTELGTGHPVIKALLL